VSYQHLAFLPFKTNTFYVKIILLLRAEEKEAMGQSWCLGPSLLIPELWIKQKLKTTS
jgi:hypothetical protein